MTVAALSAYVFAALVSWIPPAEHARYEADPEARYRQIASDIATAALDETPVFRGPRAAEQSAILLASLAMHESRLWAWVDDGRCNDPTWRAAHRRDPRGRCDGGAAWGIWQIHPLRGIALTDDARGYRVFSYPDENARFTGADLLRDRQVQARIAERMARDSIDRYGSLCQYTGEPCKGRHPNADARMRTAKTWLRTHPIEGL